MWPRLQRVWEYSESVFCTGRQSARPDVHPRHGLKDLVMELVGVELDKSAQSSDWGRVDELMDGQLA